MPAGLKRPTYSFPQQQMTPQSRVICSFCQLRKWSLSNDIISKKFCIKICLIWQQKFVHFKDRNIRVIFYFFAGNLWWRQKSQRHGAASDAVWDETLTTVTSTCAVSCRPAYFWCSGMTHWTNSCYSRFVKKFIKILFCIHTSLTF